MRTREQHESFDPRRSEDVQALTVSLKTWVHNRQRKALDCADLIDSLEVCRELLIRTMDSKAPAGAIEQAVQSE